VLVRVFETHALICLQKPQQQSPSPVEQEREVISSRREYNVPSEWDEGMSTEGSFLTYLTFYYPVMDQVVWYFTVLCHLFVGLCKRLAPGPLYCSLLGILLFPFFLYVVCS